MTSCPVGAAAVAVVPVVSVVCVTSAVGADLNTVIFRTTSPMTRATAAAIAMIIVGGLPGFVAGSVARATAGCGCGTGTTGCVVVDGAAEGFAGAGGRVVRARGGRSPSP